MEIANLEEAKHVVKSLETEIKIQEETNDALRTEIEKLEERIKALENVLKSISAEASSV